MPWVCIVAAWCRWTCAHWTARRAKIASPTLRQHLAGLWAMCTASRNTAWAGIGLGLLAPEGLDLSVLDGAVVIGGQFQGARLASAASAMLVL